MFSYLFVFFLLDGTVMWATTLQSIRSPATNANNEPLRHGADYFDYVCQASGPRSRNALTLNVAVNTVDIWYSRSVVCSNGQVIDTAGQGRRTAAQYFTYGAATKPVFSFDTLSRPTQFVRIAASPNALFSTGINRALSSATHTATNDGGFRTFFGGDGVVIGDFSTPTRSLATFPAWTGCSAAGQPLATLNANNQITTSFTCRDWSSTSSLDEGGCGNTGASPLQYTGTFDNTWLDLPDSLGDQSIQRCNTPSLFIYCSWIPTGDDGWMNGDETSVDCGGNTKRWNTQTRDFTAAQNFCGPCPPGTSGPVNGPCVPCAINRYSYFGGSAACSPCAINGMTTTTGSTSCICAVGYAFPSNYDVTTQARDGSLCVPLIRGDPQITGLQGQDFQVHGIPDEYFNMVSTPEMQVNSRFVFLNTARCMDNTTTCFTHPGTYIDVMAFTVGTHKVKVLAGTYEAGLRAFIGENEISVGDKQTLSSPAFTVEFLSKNRVLVQNGLFRFVLVNSDNFMNQEVALLDAKLLKLGATQVKISAGESAPHQEIPIHGILGQTWKNLVFPAGMFIEGEVADYRVADGAFGTDFVYNKFSA
jgi:hypothetical protein